MSAQGVLITNENFKYKKKEKKKSYLALFLYGIIQKKPSKTHFGNLCALDMKFYSITLKLGS
jgi:hypothetical protein